MLAVSLAACKAGAASLGHTFSKVLSILAFYSECNRPLIFENVSQAGPSTDTLPSWQRTADCLKLGGRRGGVRASSSACQFPFSTLSTEARTLETD